MANIQATLTNGETDAVAPRRARRPAKKAAELAFDSLAQALDAVQLAEDDVCTTVGDISQLF
jgi:hypothetical protein